MIKHTPGPWEWVKDSDGIAFLKGDGLYVLSPEFSADDERVHVDTWLDVSDANATLIAAAPDLYAAGKPLANYIAGWADLDGEDRVSVRVDALRNLAAAIAKAEAA